MHIFAVVMPALGIVLAASVPLVRYALKDRHERAAIEVVREIHDAQRALLARSGAYATASISLTSPCGGEAGSAAAGFERLREVGYQFELRPAGGALTQGVDCHGQPLASNYYLGVRPASADGVPRQSFATSGAGQIYLFHDGIPPREADMASGLATPIEARDTFRIP